MNPPFTRNHHVALWAVSILALCLCLLAGTVYAAGGAGPRYRGQVLYRANKSPVPGVLVELVEAEDDGQPTDEVLGQARADAQGRFAMQAEKSVGGNVALVVSAVRVSAESGGDRRGEGYEVRSRRTRLGYLPRPSATRPNTILIERRKPGRNADDSDDD